LHGIRQKQQSSKLDILSISIKESILGLYFKQKTG
jgi:hypothetical protein